MSKPKLLFLSQCFPLPLDGGGKIKTFATLSTLAKKFDIFAVFVSERKAKRDDLIKLKKLSINCKIFQTNLMFQDVKKDYLKLIWNYLQLRPHFVYQYRYLPAIEFIKTKIQTWQPQIIHVDHINSSQFLPQKAWLKMNCTKYPYLILENHNLNHRLFFTRLKQTKKLIRKVYLLLEGSFNWFYGIQNYPRFDHIFAISNQETQYLIQKYSSVSTQPLIYPFEAIKQSQKKVYDLLFIGYLEWPPNQLAIEWFVNDILPLVVSKTPEVMLHVIGKNNPKIDYLSKNCNVVFHGYKKNLDPFLSQSKIFILPFKTGAGIRIKSLTAIQNGIPIVSTRLGVEGLNLTDKQEYLEANNKITFAKNIVELLNNQQLRDKISQKQNKFFAKNYNHENKQQFLKKYMMLTNIR